ncbi:MAG: response regulator [Methanomicrobiales archaeon]|nr:response regulator [Methanomicrobiales archaeon]
MRGRILVVEDDDLISHLLKIILERKGYTVIATATTGEEALAKVVESFPDLVLMDIGLPGYIDGINAASYLRTLLDVPVIFVTASGDAATQARAQRARPYGYITKPFNEREILGAIELAIHHHEVMSPGRKRNMEDEWEIPAVAITNLEGHIFYLNHAGEQLLGIDPNEAFSHRFNEVVHLQDPVTATEIGTLLKENSNGSLIRRELSLLRSDGRMRFVGVEAGVLQDIEGNTRGAICILHTL